MIHATPSTLDHGGALPSPFGWFAVAAADEVAVGQVKSLSYFNTELVIWRGEDGVVRALDPYCRHLGAHLGRGGVVVGDDLRCPFHHWSHTGSGGVSDIPYAKVFPPKLRKACVQPWPVQENRDFIYVWYHPHKVEPMWSLAQPPAELETEDWIRFEAHEWVIKIHIQEITENGMDYAHFRAVHGVASPPSPTYKIDGVTRENLVEAKMATPRGLVDARIHSRAVGPGQSFVRFHGISDVAVVQTQTAVDSHTTHVRQHFYRPPHVSDESLRVILAQARNLVRQIEQDIPIWEAKRYEPNPILVDGDGPILAYRRQYADYYAEVQPPEDTKAAFEPIWSEPLEQSAHLPYINGQQTIEEASVENQPGAASHTAAPPKTLPAHIPPSLVHDAAVYLGPNKLDDPFSLTEEMLEKLPPVFFSTSTATVGGVGSWIVTRYEDIREVYQNTDFYSSAGIGDFQALVGETFRSIPLTIDPPEHAKYRMMLNPWFSPKAVTGLEPKMRAIIGALIDGFVDKGECDLAYDYGRIYPVRVFMGLMGFPEEKLEDFLSWEYAILHDMTNPVRMKWGVTSALAYLRGFIEKMRATPGDNLTSHIVHSSIEGRPTTADEIIGTVFFLWMGGLDTVAATTSLMFRRLALDPVLQQTLRDNPQLIPEAVEEFLRVQPIVNSMRIAKQDHEIRGVQIKKGDNVTCFNAAGNFDPAEFKDPREIRLDRPSNRHFTLAGGPHRCMGSHLARRELRIALGEILARLPPFRLKPGADRTVVPGLVAAPRLPVVWG